MLGKKNGITLSSLLIYLILFTTFTIITLSVTSNLNKNIFDSRGEIENNKNLNKVIAYFVESSKSSGSVSKIGDRVVFDNNDEYEFRESEKAIYLGNKKIVKNVHKVMFSVTNKTVYLDITFEKYSKILNKELTFSVRGDI